MVNRTVIGQSGIVTVMDVVMAVDLESGRDKDWSRILGHSWLPRGAMKKVSVPKSLVIEGTGAVKQYLTPRFLSSDTVGAHLFATAIRIFK